MNHFKTETIEIGEDGNWKTCKKLGVILGTKKEWQKKIALIILTELKTLWSFSISRSKKLRIHRAYIQSIMLFRCATWGMNEEISQSIDGFNRKMD